MREHQHLVGGIRLKVLIGFGVAIIALAAAALINMRSVKRLVDSVKTLSRPDEKLIVVSQLLDNLSNEERSVRALTLTQDQKYLNDYQRFSDSAHFSLTRLKMVTYENIQQANLVDTLQQLVAQREGLLNQFIDKRKLSIDSQPVKKFRPEENSNSIIGPPPLPDKKSQASQATPPVTNKTDAVVTKTSEEKGIAGWFKTHSPFRKKEKSDENVSALKDTVISSASITPHEDLATANGAKPVPSEESEWKKQMKQWSLNEMILLNDDKEVMDLIRSKVSQLEKNESAINANRAAVSDKEADASNQMMVIVGVLGLLSTLIFIYLILSDIARSNRLRLQLMEERSRAEKLAKVKEEFLANMSHEIRTPLNAVVGFAEQLSKEHQTEKQEEFTHAIQQSSAHLLTLVNQILDLSKMESGKHLRDEQVFDFHEIIREIHNTFRIKAAEKNIWFSFRIDERVPQFVAGDVLSVKQIIINLVSNALKFTSQGGVIINCVREDADAQNSMNGNVPAEVNIKIEVKDTGMGIPKEMLDKVFDQFTQQDSSITRKFGGTGLGLAITKKLTEFLHGKIEVSSEENTGSVFTVTLPFRKADSIPSPEEEKVKEFQADPSLSGKTILIVDDEDMNVLLCKTILEKWGIKTDAAANGRLAIDRWEANNYDLILLDLQMPVMSGMESVAFIRSHGEADKRNVPVIALTANIYNVEQEVTEAGFNDILIKPFKEQVLYDLIKKHLVPYKSDGKLNGWHKEGASPEAKNGKHYNLTYLKEISGADDPFIVSMLESFITNNRQHLHLLDEALVQKDWEAMHNVAHKMIPAYRYLSVDETEVELRLLEKLTGEKTDLEKIPGLINKIRSVTEQLFVLLEAEIAKMQPTNGHSTIPDDMSVTPTK